MQQTKMSRNHSISGLKSQVLKVLINQSNTEQEDIHTLHLKYEKKKKDYIIYYSKKCQNYITYIQWQCLPRHQFPRVMSRKDQPRHWL
jgi:hypothetical protein